MLRRILSIVSVVFLLCMLPAPALAEQEMPVTVRTGYLKEDTLYTFSHFSQEAPENLEVSLFVNNGRQAQDVHPVRLKDTDGVIHYLLLVDTSSSMAPYASFLNTFAQKLLENSSGWEVTVAAMGSGFHVTASGLTSWKDVQTALRDLRFRSDGSDICGGVAEALNDLAEQSCDGGDVNSLLVITDGEPWYSKDAAVEAQREQQAAEAASAAMAAMPEVVVSTLCLRTWEGNTFDTLSAGQGLHLNAGTVSTAGEAGKTLAEFMESLCCVSFPLKGYSDTALITDSIQLFLENGWYSVGAVRNLAIKPDLGAALPIPPVDESEGTTPENTEETTEPAAQETIPETTGAVTEEITAETATVPAETDSEGGVNLPVLLWVGTGIVVVLAAVIFLLMKKKSRDRSIRIRIEVLSGAEVRNKGIFYLRDQLLIGTGKQCNVVIRDSAAAPVNARIFTQDQMVYIEDMGSPLGTALNGMRLFAPNRLRSEDEITVGNTVLRVLF